MALRKILLEGDDTLLKKSREVTRFDSRLHQLIDDMRDTLTDAKGAGLAAPQVGVLRRVILVIAPDGEDYIEIVNPKIIEKDGEQIGAEGCLSVPGLYGIVSRPMKVTAKGFDRFGKPITVTGEELVARAICHETDHLDGILFTEKVIEYIKPDEEDKTD